MIDYVPQPKNYRIRYWPTDAARRAMLLLLFTCRECGARQHIALHAENSSADVVASLACFKCGEQALSQTEVAA